MPFCSQQLKSRIVGSVYIFLGYVTTLYNTPFESTCVRARTHSRTVYRMKGECSESVHLSAVLRTRKFYNLWFLIR